MSKPTTPLEALRLAEDNFLFLATNPVVVTASEIHATADSALIEIRAAIPQAQEQEALIKDLAAALKELLNGSPDFNETMDVAHAMACIHRTREKARAALTRARKAGFHE